MFSVTADMKWNEFLKFRDSHSKDNHWFRGVTKSGDPLVPKIGRPHIGKQWYPATPKHGRGENLADREFRIFERFKRRALGCVPVRPQTDFEWLALAQHHGVPTRLLDWSTNPIVALWFATNVPAALEEHIPEKQTAIVYAIKVPKEDFLSADIVEIFIEDNRIYKAAYDGPRFLISPYFHPRVQIQRGCFSMHSTPNIPLDAHHFSIDLFEIEKRYWKDFQIRLFHLGIDAATLKADLSGLGETLDWQYKNGIAIGVVG